MSRTPVTTDAIVRHAVRVGRCFRRRRWRALRALDFIRGRGPTHPRDLEAEMGFGRVVNYWGGQSSATTHLLDQMHHRGLIRVVTRESGTRVYEAVSHPPADDSPEARTERAWALLDQRASAASMSAASFASSGSTAER
jgi:uncharacterized protein YcaQ